MPKEKESDTTELIKQMWESLVYLEAEGLKQELESVGIEFGQKGTSRSGQYFSTEANTIASHLKKLVETYVDQIVDDKHGVPVHLRDSSFWNQVARVLVPRSKQYLRSQIGALQSTARMRGMGSGIDVMLLQQEQQNAANITNRIHTRTRELALRDKLSRGDHESVSDSSIKPEIEMKQANATENRPYDVALSFAGEDRKYVDEVAKVLKNRKVKVFYDKFEKVKSWGEDLYSYFNDVYRKKARFCVMFMSKHYVEKAWTNHERKAAQARELDEKDGYILPARFDDTEVPGINPTKAYIDLRNLEPQAFAEVIIEKLKEAGANVLDVAESSVDSTTSVAVPSEKGELNIDAGFCSPYFVTEQDEETCILNDAYILVYARIISDIKKLLPVLESVAHGDRPLLVFAEDVNGEALATLIKNNKRGTIESCVVSLGTGNKAQQYRWTISRFTGATIYGDEAGIPLEDATIDGLGSVDKVISNQHRTQLFRDFGTSKPKPQYDP